MNFLSTAGMQKISNVLKLSQLAVKANYHSLKIYSNSYVYISSCFDGVLWSNYLEKETTGSMSDEFLKMSKQIIDPEYGELYTMYKDFHYHCGSDIMEIY